MTLVGADFPDGAGLGPDATLPFTLYWTTDASIEENYTLFIHLADAGDRLLYQFDGVPFGGRHPTRQWRTGAVFADTYTIPAPRDPVDGLATLSLGFYPYAHPTQRQSVYALATQSALGDRLVLAPVRVHGAPAPAALNAASVATWAGGIELAHAGVSPDAHGAPQTVRLRWRAAAAIQRDYTVFVQVLDAANLVVAQMDRPPQQGAYPTSTWRRGDVIDDTITLPLPSGEWRRVIVGLYDAGGTVLPVLEPVAGDYVTLAAR
jgi:hypothetical protein